MSLDDWTADFYEFIKKEIGPFESVEQLFTSLEILARQDPDIFAHHVLAHGFMEYSYVKEIRSKIAKEIAGSEEKYCAIIRGPDTPLKAEYSNNYDTKLKQEYLTWARSNKLPEELLERGWKEYLED